MINQCTLKYFKVISMTIEEIFQVELEICVRISIWVCFGYIWILVFGSKSLILLEYL